MNLSKHARTRAAQRNLSEEDINFIIKHGKAVRRTGAVFYQLRAKNIPDDLPGNHPYRRLVGSTVLMCACGETVVTAYRNGDAFKRDRRKAKYNNGSGVTCTNCTPRLH